MASTAQHQEIKAALERYSKEELVDLMEHLLRIYVLNEPVKLDSAVSKPESIREFAGYSFPQLLTWLQNNLEMEELDKFRVTPYTVMVTIGDAEFDLNGPTPVMSRETPADEDQTHSEDDEEMSPAERMDAMELDNKPWRRAPQPVAKKSSSHAETPTMADLFADDNRDRGFSLFTEPPEKAEDPDEPPPIADVAPGDDPTVANDTVAAPSTDFAKTAASRDEAPASAKQETPPPLADGDTQINPSNRFASLDLD